MKPKQVMRSLVTPLRMNAGMDDDIAPKKPQPEVFDGPLLSSRDKAKIERRKRKEERQREVIFFLQKTSLRSPHDAILGSIHLMFSIFPTLLFYLQMQVFLPDYALLSSMYCPACWYRFNIKHMSRRWRHLGLECLLFM